MYVSYRIYRIPGEILSKFQDERFFVCARWDAMSLPTSPPPPPLSLSLSLSLSRRHACEVLEERMSMSPPKGATSLLSHLPQRNCEIDTNRMFSPSPRCRANYLLRSKTLPANLSRRRGSEMYPECYKERRSSLTRTFFFLFF